MKVHSEIKIIRAVGAADDEPEKIENIRVYSTRTTDDEGSRATLVSIDLAYDMTPDYMARMLRFLADQVDKLQAKK